MQRLAELTATAIVHQSARAHAAGSLIMSNAEKMAQQVKEGHEAMQRFDGLIRGTARREEP
jgi:hypothetical protein